ncbi:proteinase [Streptomyces sulfonofaciens]|uniref:Proteinase n=1 Tax=Streptomyces sulfonofaciens TaxID=68272 RepID=A0A919GIE4_9ACTN|nr:alpha/beta hydrolase [Streptomyces sulfonofaciens]GHH85370.1 proteinase [Streptomyces sulfonofaciens]
MNTSRRPGRSTSPSARAHPTDPTAPGPGTGRASAGRAARLGFLRTAGALLAAGGLLVSGCSSGRSTAQEAAVEAVVALPEATPRALAPYYGQRLGWRACSTPGFQCATMKAPLDYAEPGAGDIKLAVARKKATGPGKRLGSLLVNPGGPGGSAIGYLQSYAALGYPADVRARYDMVAVDPRGVADSEPVTCLDGKQMDTYTQTDTTPDDSRERAKLVSAYKTFAAGCRRHSAAVLPHVSTVEAARDMDILRAVLGDKRLTYVGASYGTFLGATYAGLYPRRVGRMVLDGAMDPTLSARRMNLEQTAGFETAFESFAKDCARRSDCPLGDAPGSGTGDDTSTSIGTDRTDRTSGTAAPGTAGDDRAHEGAAPGRRTTPADVGAHLKSFFRRLDRAPLAAAGPGGAGGARGSQGAGDSGSSTGSTGAGSGGHRGSAPGGGRMLGEALATTGVIAAMYDEAAWPQLRAALTSAIEDGDGSGLLALSDSYYEREDDGRYANLMFANAAVNCLDLPPAFTTADQVAKALPDFEKASPVFGESLAWASLTCAYWPEHATGRPHRIEADGAPPIVVVGTVRDPATPYRWARALAAQLSSARLLTYNGDGHTAYGRGSTCIDGAINRYLVSGTAPKDGKRCS